MKNPIIILLQTIAIFLFLASIPFTAFSQNYFKLIDTPLGSYYQGIADFPNGDLLLCDRIHNEAQPFAAEGAYLIRLNECGEVVWAKTYQNNGWIFSFEHVDINEAGEIFVLGNWYLANEYYTAVLKLDSDGSFVALKTFDVPEVMFHNNYKLKVKDGQVTIFSFLQTLAAEKYNHVFTLNEDLETIWNKRISPYEAYGEYTMTEDSGILYQTGNSFIKLNADGEPEWGKRVGSTTGFNLFSRPLAVSDGYIIGIYSPNAAYYFFKIDETGNLVWQTQEVPAFYHVPEMQLLENGDILVTYNSLMSTMTVPCYLTISPTGQLSLQRRLAIDFFLNTGFTYPILNADGRVNIYGNAQMAHPLENHFKDFVLQFNVNAPNADCYFWEVLDEAVDYDIALIMNPLPITVEDIDLLVETHTSLIVEDMEVVFNEVCPIEPAIDSVFVDTLLNCTETWTVHLPDEEFIWEDGNTDNPRILKLPGIYTARKVNCIENFTQQYELLKNECDCDIFIPNVFSPNQDGVNDELKIYSDCEILNLDVEIFNRWGALLFSSSDNNDFWDGTFNTQKVNTGTYLLKMTAQVQDGIGQIYEFEKFQSVLVL